MGSNQNGQLGLNDPTVLLKSSPTLLEFFAHQDKRISKISSGGRHNAAVTG
jgi:alpha-tubulin suppressor-like RCC1 family protein